MLDWIPIVSKPGFNSFGQIDPYIDWAFGAQGVASPLFPTEAWHPLLLKLKHRVSSESFEAGAFLGAARPSDWGANVRVPQISHAVHSELPGQYFTALVRPRFFGYFMDGSTGPMLFGTVDRMCISRPVPRKALPPSGASTEIDDLEDEPVATSVPAGCFTVTGVIDDGLAIVNARFRDHNDMSRVEWAWMQDGTFNAAASRYGYGRVLRKGGSKGIDAAIAASRSSSLVDEDEVYERLGLVAYGARDDAIFRTVGLHASHGTHVMDIACGMDPASAAVDRPVVCVQLPAATDEGTSGASLDTHVVDALRFIVEKADDLARARGFDRAAVVVNLSFGTLAGRHDGTSDLELAMDEFIERRGETTGALEIVIPAGNGRLARCHAALEYVARGTQCGAERELEWRILPDDRTTSHLEIWMPKGAPIYGSRVELRIAPPGKPPGTALGEEVGTSYVWGESAELGQCYIRYCYVPAPTDRGMFLVTVRQTAVESEVEDPRIVAPAGIWRILLRNLLLPSSDVVNVWIQRDDTRFGHPVFGRQSHFELAPCEITETIDEIRSQFDGSPVRRSGTLNGIATGRRVIVVGGLRQDDRQLVDYSGEGPAGSRAGPDRYEVSDRSHIRKGLLASGTRSGSCVAVSGTSVAAPQYARKLVDQLKDKTNVTASTGAEPFNGELTGN